MTEWINATWRAPKQIRALTTTRIGGVSLPPYNGFNLAQHVGDNPLHVEQNRTQLIQNLSLPSAPFWLDQTHSTTILTIDSTTQNQLYHADGIYTNQPNKICAVMTADCLPVLFCSVSGDEIAAAHAGWRGLCDGILENTLRHFSCPPEDILVWLGPAIGEMAFEVGAEVKDAFVAKDRAAETAFKSHNETKYLANIYLLAKQRLFAKGVTHIYGGEYCTVSDKARFFSYRRDGVTGRMASLIWRTR